MKCITHSRARRQIYLPVTWTCGKPQTMSRYPRISCGHLKLGISGTIFVTLTLQTGPLLMSLAWLWKPSDHWRPCPGPQASAGPLWLSSSHVPPKGEKGLQAQADMPPTSRITVFPIYTLLQHLESCNSLPKCLPEVCFQDLCGSLPQWSPLRADNTASVCRPRPRVA